MDSSSISLYGPQAFKGREYVRDIAVKSKGSVLCRSQIKRSKEMKSRREPTGRPSPKL